MDVDQKRALLRVAREAIAADLSGRPPAAVEGSSIEETAYGGAFVTLHNRGRLRGCIGTFAPEGPLPRVIRQMAIEAAHDPRFLGQPVSLAELAEIDIEISILSKMERTDEPLSLELGVHGIYIRRGFQSGCFLPQVASDRPHWTKEEFLSRCCADKARLPADAWRGPDTQVFLFTADVFGEKTIAADGAS
jgi:AmmeMemoRadiSam system protein A